MVIAGQCLHLNCLVNANYYHELTGGGSFLKIFEEVWTLKILE